MNPTLNGEFGEDQTQEEREITEVEKFGINTFQLWYNMVVKLCLRNWKRLKT